MKYLVKFNEVNSEQKILSNDRIEEIIKDIASTSSELDKIYEKYETIANELEEYTSQNKSANNQIDDSFVNINSFTDKLQECKNLILLVSGKLEDYTKEGEKYLS